MNVEGTHLFDAPQELVWRMLLDPIVLAKVMPNCQALEKTGEGEYEGKMKIQVGPVQGVFQGKVILSNLQAPNSYHMHVQGKGPAGVVDGEGSVQLEQVDGKTVMSYTGEAKVSGRIASIGQRLMDTSARAIIKQSLDNLEQQIVAAHNEPSAPSQAAIEPELPVETTPFVATEASKDAGVSSQEVSSDLETRASVTAKVPQSAPFAPPPTRLSTQPSPQSSAQQPSSASPTQFAVSIVKELFNEFVPADKQKWVLAAVGFLLVHLYLNWWANAIVRRVVRKLE